MTHEQIGSQGDDYVEHAMGTLVPGLSRAATSAVLGTLSWVSKVELDSTRKGLQVGGNEGNDHTRGLMGRGMNRQWSLWLRITFLFAKRGQETGSGEIRLNEKRPSIKSSGSTF
ncbi:hypothetical protein GOP47_0020513 [Adiantum capillus-veneris]|uniref:Uncharacterized protein n=1 Tax=Adiantum capillus-veneris TaxID=13818 RepID=A0A9D4UA77_ADICA|nr:hypothetical protein GOP47_0020513 [Adiantum capillus-veneris]